MITSIIACCLFTAALEIDIAPDQPLPFVYTDDPLVIELRSDTAADVTVQVKIQSAHKREVIESSYGPVRLHPNGRHWQALKDLPSERGYYTANITAAAGGVATEKTVHFCRMDRVAPTQMLPLYAQVDTEDAKAFLALSAAGITTLRIDAASPSAETQLKEALAANFKAVIFLDCGRVKEPVPLADKIAGGYASGIVRWEIDPKGSIETLGMVAEALGKAGSVVPLAITVSNAADFQALMEKQAGRYARESVLVSNAPVREEISAIRRIAESAGFEGWGIHVFSPDPGTASPKKLNPLMRLIFQNMMSGVLQTGFNANQVYDTELHESFALLAGLVHRLPNTHYSGVLALPEPVMAPVFQSSSAWMLVVWTEGDPYEATISLGAARELRLTDAMNNPARLGEVNKGSIALTVDATPKYLSGVAGSPPGMAARQRAQELASRFSGDELFQKNLPQEMMANLSSVASKPGGETIREQWLNLVRCFPVLEEQWHTGKLPQAVAVTALADLTGLLRALCTVEEDRGQPFLEPLQDALARCKEYQSLYLTGSVATDKPHERGDWLLSEVRRLMDEAEVLAASGAKIEAVAVATLAEWRARSLEFTMLTPVAGETAPSTPASTPPSAPAEQKTAAPASESSKAESSDKASSGYEEIVHTVVKGENPSVIAKKYGVSTADFLEWNDLKKSSTMHIGQKMIVRVPVKGSDDSKEEKPKETTRKKSSSRKKR
ncbi:MAG TPA: LysM peptidoglycan-binding domain-containing protein [Candidatus Hydrogenedentes bacterium]|nr:LysM peptidoglycan-binding domain-containing protein [Candidatus Hydrogenedentota bacterium]